MAGLRKTFGHVVRQLREAQGYTQEKLAERVKISRNYLGNIERGENNVTLEIVDQLAEALGIPMSDLLAEIERQRRH